VYNMPPQPVRITNTRPTAKSLWDKLKSDQAEIEKWLEEREETYDLAVELHTPAGTKNPYRHHLVLPGY
jgi:hypothetical protein